MIETDEERQKFTQLYETYCMLIFYVADQILNNREDAKDAVHQAFLSVIENLNKNAGVNCPETRAYVVIITEHKIIDILCTRKHFVDGELDESVHGMEIPLPGDNGLADAMAKLPRAIQAASSAAL